VDGSIPELRATFDERTGIWGCGGGLNGTNHLLIEVRGGSSNIKWEMVASWVCHLKGGDLNR